MSSKAAVDKLTDSDRMALMSVVKQAEEKEDSTENIEKEIQSEIRKKVKGSQRQPVLVM